MEKYYLVEPTHLQNNGILKGTSLRCYEVTREMDPTKSWRINIQPTGVAYYYRSETNTFEKKKTKATLVDKYVSSWNTDGGVVSKLQDVKSYGSVLFANPHLAIIAKIYMIQENKKTLEQEINKIQKNIDNLSAYDDIYDEILNEYPEHII